MHVSFRFVYGVKTIPKEGKMGEDAYFVCERALGVADGVSGWAKYGVNSSGFSSQIMNYSLSEIKRQLKVNSLREGVDGIVQPQLELLPVLTKAYEKVNAIGSSTVAMVAINGHTMVGLNLGDSGFVSFTKMDGTYVNNGVSKEQQHDFNTPFQLSRLPGQDDYIDGIDECDLMELREMNAQKRLCADPPEAGDGYTLPIHEDDIVVLGSDGTDSICDGEVGLFDNLFKEEIKCIIRDIAKQFPNFDRHVAQVVDIYAKAQLENGGGAGGEGEQAEQDGGGEDAVPDKVPARAALHVGQRKRGRHHGRRRHS